MKIIKNKNNRKLENGLFAFVFSLILLMTQTSFSAEGKWYPFPAIEVTPAFASHDEAQENPVDYIPLEKAEKEWDICVALPHVKDAYFLGVDYGVIEQANDLGVKVTVVEAGGYTELAKQVSQIEDCVARGANAVVLGAISYDGLNRIIEEVTAKGIPVIDFVNGISSNKISARSLVSFYTMGYETGKFLATKHPSGSEEKLVGFFPGPAGAGWVEAANQGFHEAAKDSALRLLEPKYGDTGKEVQLKLVEDVLQANPDIDYIVGTAVTAEASQGILRERGLMNKVGLLAFYMTPGVFRGIERGFIDAATTGSMVIQSRIAVDQAVRILENKPYIKHVAPKVFIVDKSNINDVERQNILPPQSFKAIFNN